VARKAIYYHTTAVWKYCITLLSQKFPPQHWMVMVPFKKALSGVMTHACLSYREDYSSRPAQAKNLWDPHLNQQAGHGGMHLLSQLHSREAIGRWIVVLGQLQAKTQDPIGKLTTAKRAVGMAQVGGYLHSKLEVLSSNPSTAK
jgi:hypothetical protein